MPKGAFNTFFHLGVRLAVMVLRRLSTYHKFFIIGLRVPEKRVKLKKAPF